jgi:hypothetical protein
MTIILDGMPQYPDLPLTATLADALAWAQRHLPPGKLLTNIEVDGAPLEGSALADARPTPLGKRSLAITSADQKELSFAMLGRLAALIEWLAPQHKQVAALLEKGQQAPAFEGLARIFSTWQNIQSAYAGLAKMNGITLADLPVRTLTGEALLNEFCLHLGEMQTALQNRDLVMLADILQYEMDGAVANWNSLLEATLAVIDPVAAAA